MTEENNMAYCFACKKDGGKLTLLAQPPSGNAYLICEECDKNRSKPELIEDAKAHWNNKHGLKESAAGKATTDDGTAAELHAEDTKTAADADALADAETAAADLDEELDKLKTELE